MTKCNTADTDSVFAEAQRMIKAGAEIIRAAVLNESDIAGLKALKTKIKVPLVADIHYHKKLAILAMESGADKIRKPGEYCTEGYQRDNNAGKRKRNSRSDRYKTPAQLRYRGLSRQYGFVRFGYIKTLSGYGLPFHSFIIKNPFCRRYYCLLQNDSGEYGLSSAFRHYRGSRGYLALSKSALGIGALLLEGIGDTIRVLLQSHRTRI
jgi:(E)-4-hydroxy-3-methylbut-2-enyl-diphosphate synthase